MFFKHQIISRINKPMSRLLILILVFCFPLFSQVLTGSLGLRGGINYNVFNDQEGNKWTGSGQHIALEIGVNIIRPLELVTNVSYLTTNYSYSDTNIIYYTKYSKQYNNIYIPFRLRLNLWTFGFLQPNIEFGGAIKNSILVTDILNIIFLFGIHFPMIRLRLILVYFLALVQKYTLCHIYQ